MAEKRIRTVEYEPGWGWIARCPFSGLDLFEPGRTVFWNLVDAIKAVEASPVDHPSDGSCVRCGSVPRNASGLCATCLDEDAERVGEIQSQALWRQALDAEKVLENGPASLADATSNPHPTGDKEGRF